MQIFLLAFTLLFSASTHACQCYVDSNHPVIGAYDIVEQNYGIKLTAENIVSERYSPSIIERLIFSMDGVTSCASNDSGYVYVQCMKKRTGKVTLKIDSCLVTMKVVTKDDNTAKAAILKSSCPKKFKVERDCGVGPRSTVCKPQFSLKSK
jgi:hypothetical protein